MMEQDTKCARGPLFYRGFSNGSHYVKWAGVGEFLVSPDGSDIAMHSDQSTPSETVESYLVTQALSFALLNAGCEPIHATAVTIDDQAVAFLGDSGMGKSTLAAAFIRAGHRILTDDLLLLTSGNQGGAPFIAQPGPLRLKLFPDVAKQVLMCHGQSWAMNPFTPKLIFQLSPEQHCPSPRPLRALYLLRLESPAQQRSCVTIRPVRLRHTLLELLAHSYNSMVCTPDRLRRHFLFASQIARRVPIRSLSFRHGFGNLPSVVAAVHRDIEA